MFHTYQFPFLGQRSQIDCVFGQSLKALFGLLRVNFTVATDALHGILKRTLGDLRFLERGGNRGILKKSEDQVVLSDKGVALFQTRGVVRPGRSHAERVEIIPCPFEFFELLEEV
jgi:hypothetical protein